MQNSSIATDGGGLPVCSECAGEESLAFLQSLSAPPSLTEMTQKDPMCKDLMADDNLELCELDLPANPTVAGGPGNPSKEGSPPPPPAQPPAKDPAGSGQGSAPLSRASSRCDTEGGGTTDNEYMYDDVDEMPAITLGICAMRKKTHSKPMKQILNRLEVFEYLQIVIFDEETILHEAIEDWPLCDCLISFYSTDFPLDKAIAYAKLREPFCINDLQMQKALFNRRDVYKILQREGLPVPRYAVVDRDDPNFEESSVIEEDDSISINGKVFKKPFVEKPLDAEDHNVTIYFQSSAGGGCQKLFRKIGCVSSMYSSESRIRKTGSYLYEEFKPTDGCDVKVYAVGPEYAHAEARKAPGLDGKVERDRTGKEVRYPVLLSHFEKFIARTICIAFKQTVCGFDLLRTNGKSFICDVNGFSFVKNSSKYYDDCAKILGTILLKHMAPDFNIPLHLTVLNEEIPVVPTTRGTMMELRCVIGVIRHGDRQPKQKMKMEVYHSSFFQLFAKFGGSFTAPNKNKIKLKQPQELQAILDTALALLEKPDEEILENVQKLEQLKTVLQMQSGAQGPAMYGHFSGINRKVQMKCVSAKQAKTSSSEDDGRGSPVKAPSILLIAKWGGELTPLGRVHSEALGKAFRCMYPGGSSYNDDGSGLLRLHSTFRHDLKIYASDEGRVQMTAAAFAKGLLALDGELTPILVHMVKCAKTNGLLDHDETDFTIPPQEAIKNKLSAYFSKDSPLSPEEVDQLIPTADYSLVNSLHVVKNPVHACEEVYQMIQKVASTIRQWISIPGKAAAVQLYNSETLDMMSRRWNKLEKDFKLKPKIPIDTQISTDKNGGQLFAQFDISKIPDIYDCIKYDTLHNSHLGLPCQNELYASAKALADIVVPQEYGIHKIEKFKIALKICTPLLRKIRCDLQRNLDQSAYRLHPKYSENVLSPNRQVRTRLYFTSESHIHSLVNIIRFGGLFDPESDLQWQEAERYLSSVTELNYLSQLVFLLYEDPTKDVKSEERYKLEVQFSPGIRYWEESETYPIGTKFIPKPPQNLHNISARDALTRPIIGKGSVAASLVHTPPASPLAGAEKPAAGVEVSRSVSASESELQRRHRSAENLQARANRASTLSAGHNRRSGTGPSPHKKREKPILQPADSKASRGLPSKSFVSKAASGHRRRITIGSASVDGNRATHGAGGGGAFLSYNAFFSGNVNSGSAPNLSSIYHEKMRNEAMLPTAVKASKLLESFCPVKILHNNLNVGELERFLDHVTESQGVKTPDLVRSPKVSAAPPPTVGHVILGPTTSNATSSINSVTPCSAGAGGNGLATNSQNVSPTNIDQSPNHLPNMFSNVQNVSSTIRTQLSNSAVDNKQNVSQTTEKQT